MAGETVLIEPLNGGLVTSRDPSMLNSGELELCNNTIYRPNDDAIWKAPGRNAYNTAALATPVKGLRVLTFDTLTNPWIIAYYGSTLAYSEMLTEAQNFTTIATTFGSGATLDSVFYNNKHYLLKGVGADDGTALEGPNHAALASASGPYYRRHGLAPVVSMPPVVVNTGTGYGWPVTKSFPAGWYFFLITEVHDVGGADELESAFEGTPSPAKITLATQGVLVTFPTTLVNDGTDSQGTPLINAWRVYMSTALGTQPDLSVDAVQPPFPSLDSYSMVAEVTYVAGAQTTIIGQGGTQVGPRFPGAEVDVTSTWTIKSNDRLDDSLNAGTSTIGAKYAAYTFGFTTVTGAVAGISVEVKWRCVAIGNVIAAQHSLNVALTKTAAGANTPIGGTTRSTGTQGTTSYRIDTFGGPQDTWGTTWALGDINGAAAFGVLVTSVTGGTYTTLVDYVKVTVYSGVIRFGQPYPVVSINVGDEIIVESANSEPPVASTGDVFESQMMVNDLTNRAIMRYSIPDKVEYFPKDYYLQFSSKEQDVVTCVRRLGNKAIVGLKHQLYRVNYLPRQLDAEFDRGRSVEAISETHGIIGAQAAALFSPPDKPQMLAYVSSQGIHATDGYQTTTLSEDLDWQNTVAQAFLDTCLLINYPKLYSLVLYYTPFGAVSDLKKKALWFNYHPSHVKSNGKLLVSGPNDVWAASVTMARRNNEWTMLTGHLTDGKVYVEDREYDSDDSNARAAVDIRTRRLFQAGIGYETTTERVWVRHSASSPAITWTCNTRYQNTDGDLVLPTDWFTDTFTTTLKTLSRLDGIHVLGESHQYQLTTPDLGASGNSGNSISYIGVEVGGHGLQDNPSA
jgi:hypothetical protein